MLKLALQVETECGVLSGGFVQNVKMITSLVEAANLVHLLYDTDAFEDRLFAAMGIAAPVSLHRAAPKRRAEFLAGRLAAREALRPLGLADHTVDVGTDRAPIWPQEAIGSISHCAGHAVALCLPATAGRGIGVDVERIVADAEMRELSRLIATLAEFALLSQRGHVAPPDALAVTLMFSAKESVYKAVYPLARRIMEHDAIELVAHDATACALVFSPRHGRALYLERELLKVRYAVEGDLVFTASIT